MSALLGKQQLLAWANQATGVSPCTKYDDLKDGLIFLALLQSVFPSRVEEHIVKSQRVGARNPKLNWELLRSVMGHIGLPLHLCDRKGIAAGHQKPCYNMLVMFYFLSKLSSSTEFAVDFAHPIDERLAAFLQSPESLQCLSKGNDENGEQRDVRSMSPAHPVSSPVRRASPPTPRGGTAPTPSQRAREAAGLPPQQQPQQHQKQQMTQDAHGVLWSDRHSQEHGEVIITRLRNDVQASRREQESLKRELQHVRALSQHALDQQRTMVEAEMTRAQEQFAAQLATVKLEGEHELRGVFARCKNELEQLEESLELERNIAAFGGGKKSVEALSAEVSELRSQRAVLETKLQTTKDELDKTYGQVRVHQDHANAARAQYEKLSRTLEATMARAAATAIPEVIVDSLGPAEQQPIVMRMRQMQLELDSLKAGEARREEELRSLRERTGGSAHQLETNFDANVETNRLRKQVDRLKAANEFLHQQLARVKEGQDTGIARDYNSLLLSNDLSAPSTTIGHHKVEDICAGALSAVKRVTPSLPPDVAEDIRSTFWDLVAACNTLQARVGSSAKTLVSLNKMLNDANKAAMVERHSRQHEVTELRSQATRSEADLQAAHAAQLSQLQLDIRLERDELLRTRMEMDSAVNRMQATCTSMLGDCERSMSDVKSKNSNLSRAVTQLQKKDGALTELVGLLRAAKANQYVTPQERQVAEARITQLTQVVASIGDLDASMIHSLNARETDAAGNVRECLGQLRQTLETSLMEVRASVEMSTKLRSQLRDQALELEQSNNKLQQQAKHITSLEANREQLRQELERQVRNSAEAAATRNSAEHTFAALAEELQQYCDSLYEIIGQHQEHAGLVVPKKPHTQRPRVSEAFAAATESSTNIAPFSAPKSAMSPTTVPTETGSEMAAPVLPTVDSTIKIAPPTPSSPLRPLAAPTTSGVTSNASGVLSPNELERRKQEILARYGVKA